MLLVIYGHLAERSDFLRIIIYSFHMPLFFIISGYYFNAQADFRAVLKKGLKQIVAPAYLFLVLDFLLINHNDDLTLKNIVNSLIFRGGVWWNSPIWFILALFQCRLMFILLNENKIKWISLIMLLLCIIGFNKYLPTWWSINAFICLPFFYLGYELKKIDAFEKTMNIDNISLVIGLMLLISISLFNGYTDLNVHLNGKSFLFFALTAIFGTLVTINLSYRIWRKDLKLAKVFAMIGRNSLIVLLTHYYICRWVVSEIFGLDQRGILCNLMLTALISVLYGCVFRISHTPTHLIK